MKTDLDRIMQDHNLEAILVTGKGAAAKVPAKAKGKKVRKRAPEAHERSMDISQALAASIEQVRKHA